MSSTTALLVVDMVVDFTQPHGRVYYAQNREILPCIARALAFCREQGMLVVFLQHRYRRDKFDRNLVTMRPNCMEGSGGEEIDPSLQVDPVKDYVIQKRRYSGFFGTDLDLVLREHGIRNVVIVGTKTNCCIRATVTDAYNLDYNALVLSDCVATNSETVNAVHLDDIARYLGTVLTTEELMARVREGTL
jgi:nicotinamidase-related amidase